MQINKKQKHSLSDRDDRIELIRQNLETPQLADISLINCGNIEFGSKGY